MIGRHAAIVVVVSVLALTSCGASNGQVKTRSTGASSGSVTTRTTVVTLQQAVKAALEENHRLAIYVLWHNQVPSWATNSTRGPALTSLQQAGMARQKRGVRVRLVRDDFHVVSIHLSPSYASATAIARGKQQVRPYGLDGKPLGQTVFLDEHARIVLHRLGSRNRFVVWKVALIR